MRRRHLVLDTNVLVSALLFGGPPREVLNMIVAGGVDCSLSIPLLEELKEVLQRPKFGVSPQQALALVERLSVLCKVVSPAEQVSVVSADPDDNRVLECALAARADVIVSGDMHLRELGVYAGIRILSPSEFLDGVGRNRSRVEGDEGLGR